MWGKACVYLELCIRMLIIDLWKTSWNSLWSCSKETNLSGASGQRLFLCSRLTSMHPCIYSHCCARTHTHTKRIHKENRRPSDSITSNYKTGYYGNGIIVMHSYTLTCSHCALAAPWNGKAFSSAYKCLPKRMECPSVFFFFLTSISWLFWNWWPN